MPRYLLYIIVGCILLPSSLVGQSDYFTKVKAYRDSIDAEFSDVERTILKPEDLAHFSGLHYYETDPKFRVKAKFKPIKDGQTIKMKTSGKRTPEYKPYGVLSFKLDGKKCKLTLYQNCDSTRPELKNYLLLAFTDLTNGFETYGGGRYLDFMTEEITSEMYIDFNYCYNPYCAYGDRFSCVIPPAENSLKVAVKAGVKKFHD